MKKSSNRQKILIEGMRLVLERGFFNASVRDIIEAAGVPQGSFTNHFKTKEMFGMEILQIHHTETKALLVTTLCNHLLNPVDALRAFFEASKSSIRSERVQFGSLSVNFCAEASMHSERVRKQLLDIFEEITAALADCLERAIAENFLRSDIRSDALAAFMLHSLQGAILLAKVSRTATPIEQLEYLWFDVLNAPGDSSKSDSIEPRAPVSAEPG